MAKKSTSYELVLPHPDSGVPAYQWLYHAIRSEILAGRLRPGMRLPASRDLARQYCLARGTVTSGFDQLRAEGYLEGKVGSGTYVSSILPDDLLQLPKTDRPEQTVPLRPQRVSEYAKRVERFANLEVRPSRAFRANMPALNLFPTDLWAQVAVRRLRRASTHLLIGCSPMGYLPLRGAVAEYLSSSRGVKCAPEQIAILSGVQEAIDLAARLFVDPGDRVCVEDPGYPGASIALTSRGARVSAIPVDDEGMQLPPASLRGVRLAYVTPGHQFPLGVTMSLSRRLQLLDWARRAGSLLLEDDYDGEYRYQGRPVPSLQGLDQHGLVMFTGSFSKVLFPSLRLGYLVVPEHLVDYVSSVLSITIRHAPLLEQAVLCDFVTAGHFGRHLRRMREVYAERYATLLDCARERWNGLLEISGVEAGLQTAAWLREGPSAKKVAATAAERGIEVTPLSSYCHLPLKREGLLLGFAAVDAKEIRRGVRELAHVLDLESHNLAM